MIPTVLSLMAGTTVFLLLWPGRRPGSSTPLDRLYARMGASPQATQPTAMVPWVRKLPLRVAVTLVRLGLGPQFRGKIERLLRISGLEQTHTYDDILALKVATTLGCWAYVALIMAKRPDPLLGAFLGSFGVLGFGVPDGWLRRRARLRQEQIARELPAMLSALAVALEAGLHLMGAIAEVGRNRGGLLATQLRLAVDRCERGMAPAEALEALTAQLEVSELTVVLTGLIQAFAKGSGHVVQTVRRQAAEAWQKRRRRAEAQAQTASIRFFLPLVLLALPGFLIFLLGPAVLEVVDYIAR